MAHDTPQNSRASRGTRPRARASRYRHGKPAVKMQVRYQRKCSASRCRRGAPRSRNIGSRLRPCADSGDGEKKSLTAEPFTQSRHCQPPSPAVHSSAARWPFGGHEPGGCGHALVEVDSWCHMNDRSGKMPQPFCPPRWRRKRTHVGKPDRVIAARIDRKRRQCLEHVGHTLGDLKKCWRNRGRCRKNKGSQRHLVVVRRVEGRDTANAWGPRAGPGVGVRIVGRPRKKSPTGSRLRLRRPMKVFDARVVGHSPRREVEMRRSQCSRRPPGRIAGP